MNALTKVDDAEIVPSSMLEIISRAAADPNTDVTKLERLMAMAERLEAQSAAKAFDAAMVEAQKGMEPVRTDASNKSTSSKYASYPALDRAIRPIYTTHGFAISYDTGDSGSENSLRVLAYVSHGAGHRKTYKIDMPADGKGAKGGDVMTKTHAVGSAFTYGKRYLLGGIFNIVVSDDDGNSAGDDGPITADQMAQLQEVMQLTNSDPEKVCKAFKLEALKDITKRQLPRVIEALNSQPRKKA